MWSLHYKSCDLCTTNYVISALQIMWSLHYKLCDLCTTNHVISTLQIMWSLHDKTCDFCTTNHVSFAPQILRHLHHLSCDFTGCSKWEIIDGAIGSTCVQSQRILLLQSLSSSITTNTEILILYFTTTNKQTEVNFYAIRTGTVKVTHAVMMEISKEWLYHILSLHLNLV